MKRVDKKLTVTERKSKFKLVKLVWNATAPNCPKKVEVVLRSGEATLYYLGQLTRCQLSPGECDGQYAVPKVSGKDLFVVTEGTLPKGHIGVTTEYARKSYYVVQKPGMSTTVLSFLSLLIGQHKEIKNFPGVIGSN